MYLRKDFNEKLGKKLKKRDRVEADFFNFSLTA
jgi:hypothetical protein